MTETIQWTEKQRIYLDVLFETGCQRQAKKEAGYSINSRTRDILKSEEMLTEVKKLLQERMVMLGPKAVNKLEHLLDNPADVGGAVLRGTATDVLDRIGLGKQDSLEVHLKQPDGIIELPVKVPVKVVEDGEETNSESEQT